MKNINFGLGKNAQNTEQVFINLVNDAAAKRLETVTFITNKDGKVLEEVKRVSYELKDTAAMREAKKHGVVFHAVISDVGGGEQSYYICEMRNAGGQVLAAFDNIVNIRQKFGISYKVNKADKFEDILKAVRNYCKSFDIEMTEIVDKDNDVTTLTLKGVDASDKKRLEKVEAKSSTQQKIDNAVFAANVAQYETMLRCGINIDVLKTMSNFNSEAFNVALANVAQNS